MKKTFIKLFKEDGNKLLSLNWHKLKGKFFIEFELNKWVRAPLNSKFIGFQDIRAFKKYCNLLTADHFKPLVLTRCLGENIQPAKKLFSGNLENETMLEKFWLDRGVKPQDASIVMNPDPGSVEVDGLKIVEVLNIKEILDNNQ